MIQGLFYLVLFMHFVYILYNESTDKFYVGETEDMDRRMHEHADAVFKRSYTSYSRGWQLKKVIQVENRIEGRRVESFIKRKKSSVFIQRIIVDANYYNKIKARIFEELGVKIQD